jgi:hypothetical protein
MLKALIRSKPIQVWFAAMMLLVARMAFGGSVTVVTAAMLFALSLVPLAIVLLVWPGVQSPASAEVLYGGDRRG